MKFTDGNKCAPYYPDSGDIKVMPLNSFVRYQCQEVHISIPLLTVLKEVKEKYIKTITTEELW